MQDLTITLIQTDISWENPSANRKMISEKIDRISSPTDIIILPEMFTTGFTMQAEKYAESMQGESIAWMREQAQKKSCSLVGSLIIREEGHCYNRLVFVSPEGNFHFYDKRHLFRMAGEEKVYTCGNKKIILPFKGWNISFFICYDLRFPAWNRNLHKGYDLAIYIANWPEKRSHHWKALLLARAIENHSYIAGVNRVGRDGNEITYSGDSTVIDPMGKILWEKSHHQCIETIILKKKILEIHRENFPVWMDEDHFEML
jgi:predicted amidohydrolase